MYAIAFDFDKEILKMSYDGPDYMAERAIRQELESIGFQWVLGNMYTNDSMKVLHRAINKLSNIGWFKKSVRDIRAFKVEDWSDFTEIVKEN